MRTTLLVSVMCYLLTETACAQPMSLVMGIDGLGFGTRGLSVAETVNLDQLADGSWSIGYNGSFSDHAIAGGVRGEDTQQPTVSGPGWSTILTGVWTDRHRVVDNQFRRRDYDSNPTYLEVLEESLSAINSSSFVNWTPIDTFILSSVDDADSQMDLRADKRTDTAVTNAAADHIRSLSTGIPATVFVALDDVDIAGHSCGSSSACYETAIRRADILVGRMLSAVQSRNNFANEDWQIVVTSDHGHRASGGHGGHSTHERRIPFIVSSQRVVPGPIEPLADQPPVSHADVAPTVLEHFGVAIPDYMWGDSRANGSAAATLLVGDFNHDGVLDVADIDILTSDAAANRNNLAFDLNADSKVNIIDMNLWIELAQTWIGDVNSDGEFNSNDLVILFQHGKYESEEPALWSEGDWDGDGRFGSSDLVAAFQNGGYEQGPRLTGILVPETRTTYPLAIGLFCLVAMRRRKLLQITTRE